MTIVAALAAVMVGRNLWRCRPVRQPIIIEEVRHAAQGDRANCTLKADPAQASSTDAMIAVLKKAFSERGVEVTGTVRVATLNIKPGVTSDEGNAAHLAVLLNDKPYTG
jgi:hypothetical protein